MEEFLQNLDIKNKIMLYLSAVVAGIIVFYNFNLNYLNAEIENNEKTIEKLQRKSRLSLKKYNAELSRLKKQYKKMFFLKNEKFQDLNYLNKRIDLSILKIDDKRFYSLLEDILNTSYGLNLNPNFFISRNTGNLKKYIIDINGTLGFCQEKNLFEFIKYLESSKYVVNIDRFGLDLNSSEYFIKYNIWGIK